CAFGASCKSWARLRLRTLSTFFRPTKKLTKIFSGLNKRSNLRAAKQLSFKRHPSKARLTKKSWRHFAKRAMRNLPPSQQNSMDYLGRSVNRLGVSISPSDDWLLMNRSWTSCTRNWKALSLTISSRLEGAHARLWLMNVAGKRFVPRTVSPRKRHAPKREQKRWIWLSTRVVVG